MSELGIRPITEKFLQRNWLFALRWREGYTFGRVLDRRIINYKPYTVIDSAGNVVAISAKSAQAELRFRDPRNPKYDLLHLPEATMAPPNVPWILHGAIGVSPPGVKVYVRFPEGSNIVPGNFPSADPIQPSQGDNVGYIDYEKSPYEQPTDFLELVIPPLLHIGAEYYNANDFTVTPKLNLLFALYQLQFFPPGDPRYSDIIRAIALRKIPAAFLTVGYDREPQSVGRLRTDWGIVPISLDEAAGV